MSLESSSSQKPFNIEAMGKSALEAVKYSPRSYIEAFKHNPGLTGFATFTTLAGVAVFTNRIELAAIPLVGATLIFGGAIVVDAVQVGRNIWKYYRKNDLDIVSAREIFNIRNIV